MKQEKFFFSISKIPKIFLKLKIFLLIFCEFKVNFQKNEFPKIEKLFETKFFENFENLFFWNQKIGLLFGWSNKF